LAREDNDQHARPSGAAASDADVDADVDETSYAERARTLVHLGRVGALSTISQRHPSWPFGSVMPYGLDEKGTPSFLVSTMAMHTQNVMGDPRASLLVMEETAAEDPLGAGRVTLMGKVSRTPENRLGNVRDRYLTRHPNASYWVDFKDFFFFDLDVTDLYFVGGFGVMGWIAAEDYREASPDPLADAARGILDHMNADHVEAMVLLARGIAGVEAEDARMTAVDRLGFHLRLKTSEGMKGVRIPFYREARTAQETRAILVEMVRAQRESA
jgi:heme oxygenase (biliverdin-IX-beta and delta-forming)